MGKIVVKKVITRKPGHLYYVDGQGNVCEAVRLEAVKRKKLLKKQLRRESNSS
jgi:hypothetical protein